MYDKQKNCVVKINIVVIFNLYEMYAYGLCIYYLPSMKLAYTYT